MVNNLSVSIYLKKTIQEQKVILHVLKTLWEMKSQNLPKFFKSSSKAYKLIVDCHMTKVNNNYFISDNNNLTSLKGSPEKIEGYFSCFNNDELTNLNGSPKYVGKYFKCGPNELTSLDSDTEYVGGNFICSDTRITSLTGAPKKVGGSIKCNWTHLIEFGDFNTEDFKHVNVFQTPISVKIVLLMWTCMPISVRTLSH